MGACLSVDGPPILEAVNGDQNAYKARYVEDRSIGEGAFGTVKLVRDISNNNTQYACKALPKVATVHDNTMYPPVRPEILKAEVDMLKKLGGGHYCIRLKAVYETPLAILLVTEYCTGGEMFHYLAALKEDLRMQDVSRIFFQLLDAVNHCANYKVLHRDIKPANIMFVSEQPGSDLRLIDFGTGSMKHKNKDDMRHTTFTGTPFYSAPEVFQNDYDNMVDVWSAGVSIYVLVSGYPADVLQKAFDTLLDDKRNDIKTLPKLPQDLPEPFYDMLDQVLAVSASKRKSAKEALKHPFALLHKGAPEVDVDVGGTNEEEETPATDDVLTPLVQTKDRKQRMRSIRLQGSVKRHAFSQGFARFERALTVLLATVLDEDELRFLLDDLNAVDVGNDHPEGVKLQAIPVNQLKDVLATELRKPQV